MANSSPGTKEVKHWLERGANGSVLPSKFLLGDACDAPPRRGVSSWAGPLEESVELRMTSLRSEEDFLARPGVLQPLARPMSSAWRAPYRAPTCAGSRGGARVLTSSPGAGPRAPQCSAEGRAGRGQRRVTVLRELGSGKVGRAGRPGGAVARREGGPGCSSAPWGQCVEPSTWQRRRVPARAGPHPLPAASSARSLMPFWG